MHSTEGYISPIAPFDYKKSLDFLRGFSPMQSEQIVTEHHLTKALFIEGQVVAFQLASSGTIDHPRLTYTLFSEQPLTDNIIEATIDRVTFFLSLNDNLHSFYAIGEQDIDFKPVLHDLYGYHQVKFPTPFECACWAVLTQRNPIAMAHRMKQSLIEQYGGSIPLGDMSYKAFPEAERVAHLSEDLIQSVVHNARKAEYLIATFKAFADIDEQILRTGSYNEVEAWLRNIRGFGEWSASFVMVRGLGRIEHALMSEKKFLEAVSRIYGHGSDLSRAAITAIAQRYGDVQGYWAHYLRVGG